MKSLLLAITVLVGVQGWGQGDTLQFDSPRAMMEYAFSNNDFSNLSSNFLTNRTIDIPDPILSKFSNFESNDYVEGKNFLNLFTYMEWWDRTNSFKRDSILYPVYDYFFTLDEVRSLQIPFYIVDMNVNTIDSLVFSQENQLQTNSPYRSFTTTEIAEQSIFYAATFLDSFAYSNVSLVLNESTVFSNKNRQILGITISNGLDTKYLAMNSEVNISDWLNGNSPLNYTIHFNDSSSVVCNQMIEMNPRSTTKSDEFPDWDMYDDDEFYPTEIVDINNIIPSVQFSTYYACADKKIRKPFIMVTGWGPFTDNGIINSNQGWPTSMLDLAIQYNQEGLIEDIHSRGFDIVFIKLIPPNASVNTNASLVQYVIELVNNRKYANNSYEENIIMGFSAGALAVRLALQRMEKNHLNDNAPHPHTKLFISNDGEHGGANIPLGIQHVLQYLWNYEYNNIPSDYNTYALHYILDAPLSRELLHYFYSSTGNPSSPGQGADVMRVAYQQLHTNNNHSLTGARLGYPSFQRMISISNGSSTPNINLSTYSSNHYPYPTQTGAIFFKQNSSLYFTTNRRFEATFLKHGVHRVFYYEKKPLFKKWRAVIEATTNNPLILDNAPGGIIFIAQNPIIPLNNELQSELTGSPDILEDHLFSFTPTILTHDVRNTSGSLPNGYLNYNFKIQKLMYDNEFDASTNDPDNASNFFGYPHLGYVGSHYDITPFDALFCWDENTEHVIGNRKSPDFYTGIYSEMKPVLKNFVVDEAEPFNIFLQNKRIGYYARVGFQYRVDYEAQNEIYYGNHVTQKTDFLPMTSEPNAVVESQAAVGHVFKPGVHLKAGTHFHAFIGDVACEKSASVNGSNDSDAETNESAFMNRTSSNIAQEPLLYPNPNKNGFSIHWKENIPVTVIVFDVSGTQVLETITLPSKSIAHQLQAGSYIVKLKINDSWYVQRMVIQ